MIGICPNYLLRYIVIFTSNLSSFNCCTMCLDEWVQMVEIFNKKVNLSGSPPLGSFNAAFSFTGSKHIDAAATKTLSTDGFYIPLAKVEISKYPLVLQENVKHAVPSSWDPPSLAR